MKNSCIQAAVVILLTVGLVLPAAAQTVNVTFRVNTSTNLDTLGENGFIEMRGALNGTAPNTFPDGNIIDWSSTSTLEMTNDGGDYWSVTFQMNPDDTLNYKFWTGHDTNTGTHPDGGWEGPFNPSNGIDTDTRTFISGSSDTSLAIQYYHPNDGRGKVDQFFRRFETKQDTITICFRVNMGGLTEAQEFDPAVNGPVGLRGNDQSSGGTFDWGATKILLTREESSVDNGSFWSGYGYIPKDSVTVGAEQKYKFFIENAGSRSSWEEGISDRTFLYTENLVTGSMDTTIHWVYFENRKPLGQVPVDATITFRVSTEALEGLGIFDRGVGDQIAVIGAKGWDINPQGNDFIDLNFIPALQEWTATEPFSMIPGTDISYKYFVRWDPSRVDPVSPNYIPNLKVRFVNDDNESSGWEEPAVTGGGNRLYTFTSDAQQAPIGDFGFDRAFFNSVPGNAVFNNAMTITWNVNMAPASNAANNSNSDHLFVPGTDSVWVQFDGSLFALSQGFETFGTRDILLEDTDGDGVYSTDFTVDPPAWYQLPFVVVYGNAAQGYISNGGGFDRGRRYYQFIQPTAIDPNTGATQWPDAFSLATLDWVETNLPVEEPPNLVTSVDDGIEVPREFTLHQNFPNPFNPETTIRYELRSPSQVKLEVYNLVGQLVRTLVDGKMPAGGYTIKWTGDDNRGRPVSTGVYFLKLKTADFAEVKKMALIR